MSAALRVPFVDLSYSNRLVHHDVLADIADLAESGSFIGGPIVRRFEYEWADYCDADYCVGVSSGLDALRISLQASGVLANALVLVPALTFVATWEAVTQAEMMPHPVDVDEDGLLDVDACPDIAHAVVPVHLYGRLATIERLRAEHPELVVIEDAAHAHGLPRAGGTAAFSFYPSKNLGAWGDAGAIITDEPDLADHARALREHGRIANSNHAAVGWTARLDAIQAAVLLEKLPHLDDWNRQREHAAWLYSEMLADIAEVRPPSLAEHHAWHIYEIRTAYDRDALADSLHAAGIGTHVHYPTPPHLTGAYAHLGYGRGDFPVAERIAAETLSLPLFPGITEQQQLHVATEIRRHFE